MPSAPELHERTARWCLGLRSVGVRKLDASELAQLRAEAGAILRKLWVLVPMAITIAVALGGFALLVAIKPGDAWYMAIPESLLVLIGGAILPASALLVVRDILREHRATMTDLQTGVVEQFRADVEIRNDNPASTQGDLVYSADVLPYSKQVLHVNGIVPPRRRLAQVYESAPPPGAVARYALPADLLDEILASVPTEGQLDRRRLTDAERGELFERARTARRPTLGLGIVVLLAAAGTVAGLVSIITGAAASDGGRAWILPVLLSVLAVTRVREFIRDWMMSRLLDADRNDGWVLVWHGLTSQPSPVEVLPRSRLVWSVADAPSKWRLTAARLRG